MTQTMSTNFGETRESMGEDYINISAKVNIVIQELDQLRNEFAKWVKEF